MPEPPAKKADWHSILEHLAQGPPAVRAGLAAGAAVLAGALFCALLYLPYRAEKAVLEAATASARRELNAQRALLEKHQNLGQMKEAIDWGYEYMRQYLPQENEMPRLVQMVSEIGAKAGLSEGVTLFAPKLPARVRPNYAEIPFSLKLQGEFTAVLNFLYDFSRMNRIVNITEVKIGSPRMIDDTMEILHITVDCSGSTYRGLTEEEVAAQGVPGEKG
jgi:type IV pilus assembly protein PilO